MSNTKTHLEQEYDHMVATANAVAIEHHQNQNEQRASLQSQTNNMIYGGAPHTTHYYNSDRENIPPSTTPPSSSVPLAAAAGSDCTMANGGNPTENNNNKNYDQEYIHNLCGNHRSSVKVPYCPNCTAQNIQTRTSHKYTGTTVAMMVGGAVVFWPAAFIPMFSKSFKQTNHHCSSCGAKIGRVKVLS